VTSVPSPASVLRLPPAALSADPCYEPVIRLPLPGSRDRIRVVELLATGTSGGAQEHLYNLVTRLDRARYDVSVLALSGGPGVRRIERTGVSVCVLDDMPDDEAIAAVAAHLAAVDADVVHNHMYRAEVIGTQAAWRLATTGRRPLVVSTVHSSRIRSEEDRALLRRLTPRMDHLIAVSRAIVRKIEDEGRIGAPVSLVYNGVDLQRYVDQEACCTLHEEYGIPEGAPIVGVVARLEPEKGHPTLLEAWPRVLASVPNAHLLIVGEGSQRQALETKAAALGLLGKGAHVTFTGRRDDIPSVTAALDVAVLPSYREAQGLSIL
jgi:glycosyltransferase involved in cell wall biosynthesis